VILCDRQIRELAVAGMIEPFEPEQVRCGISYGLSSYGYDARLGNKFKVFNRDWVDVIDPINVKPEQVYPFESDAPIVIPPNSGVLGSTVERFNIPRDVMVICLGKSTYARTHVIVNVTPLESEWSGHVTIEISNMNPIPVKIYPGMGIVQFLFLRGDPPDVSYKDRRGKYQDQESGPVLPRV